MANLEKHMADCVHFLGTPFREVHVWLDAYSTSIGAKHRKMRHHKEGLNEAAALFGINGGKAAAIHVLRDCRNIPNQSDYESGFVDALGLHQDWPVTAYIRYSDDNFEALVMNTLFGPT